MKPLFTHWKKTVLRVAISILLSLFIYQLKLYYFEFYLYDLKISTRPQFSQNQNIAMVMVDLKTVADLKRVPNLEDHQKVLEKIISAHPKAIVYNIDLLKLQGSPKDQESFATTAESFEHFYVPSELQMFKGEEDKLKLPLPFSRLKVYTATKSSDKSSFAKDNVTRRMILYYQEQEYLPLIIGRLFRDLQSYRDIKGNFEYIGSQQAFIDYSPKGSFKTYSFKDILNQDIKADELKGKLILFGKDLEETSSEYVLTPYSREVSAMTNTEMHANIFKTVIENSAPIQADPAVNFIFVLIITLITFSVVLASKPVIGLITIFITAVILSLINFLSFWLFGYWIHLSHPLLAMFICYYFFIPYRLIIENRKSWEYYQKNKLLTQVEELKTNFISMMSHDLRTPLARILGMAEIIQEEKSSLNEKQQESLDIIKQSSSDLLRFINAILKYGQIESSQLHLHLESRDINEIIKEVIKNNEFLAKVKHIQIVPELEPLFSIKIDPDLIKQVISNLVENAIKYSHEHTKILVSTEEVDGKIIIQIADQGPGIPKDELPHIFMKFFRSKNAKTSVIKGSGLGLYLAEYFIELHKGTITVESELNQGSTFTIEIPCNL